MTNKIKWLQSIKLWKQIDLNILLVWFYQQIHAIKHLSDWNCWKKVKKIWNEDTSSHTSCLMHSCVRSQTELLIMELLNLRDVLNNTRIIFFFFWRKNDRAWSLEWFVGKKIIQVWVSVWVRLWSKKITTRYITRFANQWLAITRSV